MNPARQGFTALNIGDDDAEGGLARREVGCAIDRIDDPDRRLVEDPVKYLLISRYGFLADHNRVGDQFHQTPGKLPLALLVCHGDEVPRPFFAYVGGGQTAEARQDLGFGDITDDGRNPVYVRQHSESSR